MSRLCRTFLLALALVLAAVGHARADEYVITLDPAARDEPASGRVILFFVTEQDPQWQQREPIDGPFYEAPQPIASIEVTDFKPGDSVTIDRQAVAFPKPVDQMAGPARVQAILDHDRTRRSHRHGPGNFYSDVIEVDLDPDRSDRFELTLRHVVPDESMPAEEPNLKWVELRSDLLSDFYGRDVYHRAGVALPMGWAEDADESARAEWPAIYMIPGFGGRHHAARYYALMHRTAGTREIAPQAVFIMLDPDSPLGHHGFTDSPNHGPRGTALVSELIPHLEQRFNLAARPEGRIVTGHSSGGWTSLWLQLNWPDVFGACFSSAPDPIDFRAFQMTNLYEDENLYVMPVGTPTPSYRVHTGIHTYEVAMTVEEEIRMEYAMHPLGGSGEQWDAWAAMFSPKDPETGYPKRMFDPETGTIQREVVEHWKQFDMSRMVAGNWETLGPIVTERVRLVCGELDCFYLHRAVRLFKERVAELGGRMQGDAAGDDRDESDANDGAGASGYIMLHEDATHSNMMRYITPRWNEEMRAFFRRRGLHE